MAEPARVALALQGGGAHGAFTWGVLDRLLDSIAARRLTVAAISGASAGALNAAALGAGLAHGPETARADLRQLWQTIERRATIWSPTAPWLTRTVPASPFNMDWMPSTFWREVWRLVYSPYDLWWYDNPLKDLVRGVIDFTALNDRKRAPPVYISATEVTTTRRDVFTQPGLEVDHILASACIPEMFRAVEIGPDVYWDGGFLGNPPLEPLFEHATDLVVVWINPLHRPGGAPTNARDILDRLNEITFNISLVAELRGIHLINRLIEAGTLTDPRYRPLRVHFIEAEETLSGLGLASKATPPPGLIRELFDVGRQAGADWVARTRDLSALDSPEATAASHAAIEKLVGHIRYTAPK
jgi:NTE family protein